MTDDRGDAPPGEDDSADDVPGFTAGEADVGLSDGEPFEVYELDADESPSTGVVMAVAAATGRTAASIEPLHETIDTDALDSLVDPTGSDPVRVTFTYAGTTVTVDSTRRVLVHE